MSDEMSVCQKHIESDPMNWIYTCAKCHDGMIAKLKKINEIATAGLTRFPDFPYLDKIKELSS